MRRQAPPFLFRTSLGRREEGQDLPRVDLLGEISDWQTGLPLVVREDGGEIIAERELDLPAGVYSYKLRVDGKWQLDPQNVQIRSRKIGHENNFLPLGAAPEPFFFAPSSPFLQSAPGGGFTIFAGLRRGSGEELIFSSQGVELKMEQFSAEQEHFLFRLHLPHARLPLDGSLSTEDGTATFDFWAGEAATDVDTEWWRDGVVYTIFVDRFAPDPKSTRRRDFHRDPGRDRPAFGHLDGARRALPRLKDLGVTILYLTPLIVAASCHRYDLVDPLQIDPALGGEESFARLLDEAHALGLRVLVDIAFSHAGQGFPPYEDVRARGADSPFASWFRWDKKNGKAKLLHYGKRKNAPLLDLDHPDVRALVLEAARRWAARGVDGFRLDMAAEVPIDLAAEIRATLGGQKSEKIVVGELVPAHAFRWFSAGALDSATDFGFHDIVVDFLGKRTIDAKIAADRLRLLDMDRGAPGARSMRFVSTHDHPRFSTIARKHGLSSPNSALGLFFLVCWPGVPALLYGEEYDLFTEAPVTEPEDVWPDRMPLPLSPSSEQIEFARLVKSMIALRARLPALRRGSVEILFAENFLLVFRRALDNEIIDVVFNLGPALEVDLDDERFPSLAQIFALGEAKLEGQTLSLGPSSAALLQRSTWSIR